LVAPDLIRGKAVFLPSVKDQPDWVRADDRMIKSYVSPLTKLARQEGERFRPCLPRRGFIVARRRRGVMEGVADLRITDRAHPLPIMRLGLTMNVPRESGR
jgi:hypothetical protein